MQNNWSPVFFLLMSIQVILKYWWRTTEVQCSSYRCQYKSFWSTDTELLKSSGLLTDVNTSHFEVPIQNYWSPAVFLLMWTQVILRYWYITAEAQCRTYRYHVASRYVIRDTDRILTLVLLTSTQLCLRSTHEELPRSGIPRTMKFAQWIESRSPFPFQTMVPPRFTTELSTFSLQLPNSFTPLYRRSIEFPTSMATQ